MLKEEFKGYSSRIARIRELSSPRLDDIDGPEDYAEVLRNNFNLIGDIAAENRDFLDKYLFPVLNKKELLTDEEINSLYELIDLLVDPVTVEFLDISVMSMITDRLMEDANAKQDPEYTIKILDFEVTSNYTMMNLTRRLDEVSDLTEQYRKKGFSAGTKLLAYLQPDRFKELSHESKGIVLTNARYICALYEGVRSSPDINERNINVLLKAISMCYDDFYLKEASEYDFRYHYYRSIEYLSTVTENDNAREFTADQLDIIFEHSQKLYDLWYSDPEYYSELCGEGHMLIMYFRNKYLAGRMDVSEYRRELLDIYEKRDKADHTVSSIMSNILVPVEYMATLERDYITEAQKDILSGFYKDIIEYAFSGHDDTSVGYLLEYLSLMLLSFIEVPGGMTFENMCINCMAAMHPPTYVHSKMVASITSCITSHLIRKRPESFVGMMGVMSGQEATEKKNDIIDYAYHAGLCHDFGKLMLLDTIFTYGRKLFDFEFDVIKLHPDMGAWLLSHSVLSKKYVQAARGHHRWFDESRGYPYDYQRIGQREQIIIDILTVADCMDAATDVVGRSYNRGKSLDIFIEELRAGNGTQFNPVIVDLFDDNGFIEDIKYLLENGRGNLYRNTYMKLMEVHLNNV